MISFYKYQGTGNDFVLIDNRSLQFPKNEKQIEKLCNRRVGIGGDGLILLEHHPEYDFQMVYYNADGKESSMCGNGGRCIVAFAHFLEIFQNECTFLAIDGLHKATFDKGIVRLQMKNVQEILCNQTHYILDTGSPHYVQYVENVREMNVAIAGKNIRYSDVFAKEGINVNFVEKLNENSLFVRTYERGVEDETYSCGTGVTACALTFMSNSHLTKVNIKTIGGELTVSADKKEHSFENIWLEGPAKQVFCGTLNADEIV